MVSAASFQKLALNFQEVVEQPHFEKTSFRVKGKIFATMDSAKDSATLKLDVVEQSVYCLLSPVFAVPATGAWGKQGWTKFDLSKVPKSILTEALDKAYNNVAPKGPKKSTA